MAISILNKKGAITIAPQILLKNEIITYFLVR